MLSIRCSQLSVTYAGDTRPSLDEVSVDIKPGEVVVFCGPSGSGKTTLLRCINGLVPRFYEGAFDGAVEIGGENIADWELHDIGRKVGSVFQDPRSQFFTTRGDAEIAFGCENLGMPPETIRKRVDATLKGLRGEKLRDKSVFQMSSGERQKIAVGSARAMDLPVYTLDEPSANLDVEAAEQLTEILARFKAEGRTILLAEHRLHHLMPIIDRLIYLRNGRIEVELTADELKGLRPRQLRGIGLRQTDLTRLEPAVREPNERKGSSLRCSHLSFQYKKGNDQRRVLNESRLIAHPGEIIALVGRNGAVRRPWRGCWPGWKKKTKAMSSLMVSR